MKCHVIYGTFQPKTQSIPEITQFSIFCIGPSTDEDSSLILSLCMYANFRQGNILQKKGEIWGLKLRVRAVISVIIRISQS